MKKLKKAIFSFCIFLLFCFIFLVPFAAKTSELDSRFGINAFVLNRYGWEEWHKPLALLRELKVSWTREEFVWSQIEPEEGNFNWDFYDKAFEQLANSDINILGILDYSAPWATENSNQENADKYMPNIDSWRIFIDKVVERYGRQVKYWQIWNEENIDTFFKPEPDIEKYLELLQNAYEIIKARDKDAKVVLGGTSGVDVEYLRKLKELGADQYFDILAVHPYRLDFETSPETNGLLKDLGLAEEIAEEFNNKPIWLTEFGWPTDSMEGVDEDMQAEYLVRSYLLSFTFPNIKKLFWYDFRDDGENKDWREHNFGLLKRDYIKKKSFYAYKNLINLLEHSYFDKSLSFGREGIYDLVFVRGNDEIRVLWRLDGVQQLALDTLLIDEVYNMVGEKIFPLERMLSTDPFIVTISSSPIFIIQKNKKQDIYIEENYDYEYIDQSPYLFLSNGEESELWLKLKNTGSTVWRNSGDHPMFLGTCREKDRESIFFIEDLWIGSNRAAKLNEREVKPGEIGTFGFKIKPQSIKEGKYKEYFCPVIEGVAWLKDIGIYWEIEIQESLSNDIKDDEEKMDYDYKYIGQSDYPFLSKGEVATLTLKIKNTGRKRWERGKLNLGTSHGRDRESIFTYEWLSPNRIRLKEEVVEPGKIGTFIFSIKAPDKTGIYKEYFQPVLEGVKWLKDIGIYWEIVVK